MKAWTSPPAESASILATRTGVLPPRMVGVIEGLARDGAGSWRRSGRGGTKLNRRAEPAQSSCFFTEPKAALPLREPGLRARASPELAAVDADALEAVVSV